MRRGWGTLGCLFQSPARLPSDVSLSQVAPGQDLRGRPGASSILTVPSVPPRHLAECKVPCGSSSGKGRGRRGGQEGPGKRQRRSLSPHPHSVPCPPAPQQCERALLCCRCQLHPLARRTWLGRVAALRGQTRSTWAPA